MNDAGLNVFVFAFAFAAAFLFGGKRPVLALSTRAMLLALIGLGGAGRFLPESPLRTVAIATTVLVGALFMVFAAIDFVRYRHDAALGES